MEILYPGVRLKASEMESLNVASLVPIAWNARSRPTINPVTVIGGEAAQTSFNDATRLNTSCVDEDAKVTKAVSSGVCNIKTITPQIVTLPESVCWYLGFYLGTADLLDPTAVQNITDELRSLTGVEPTYNQVVNRVVYAAETAAECDDASWFIGAVNDLYRDNHAAARVGVVNGLTAFRSIVDTLGAPPRNEVIQNVLDAYKQYVPSLDNVVTKLIASSKSKKSKAAAA
jgi:hypothetical protein